MRELKIKSQTGRELLITKEEQDRNASVTKQSTTDEFKKNVKDMKQKNYVNVWNKIIKNQNYKKN